MSGTDYTQTTNYHLYKPVSNADINQWGSHLNANADTIDSLLHGFLPLGGGTVGTLIYTATGGNTPRAAQDRAAETLYAEDYGVVPNATDNTVPLTNFFSALQAAPAGTKGRLPHGWINFSAPMIISGIQNWSLEGAGVTATTLYYKGASATVDLLTLSSCSNFSLVGFRIDSSTAMTAGTGLHLQNCGHGFLNNIIVGGQAGSTHTGGDGNLHYNLWNSFWFDMVDMITLANFEAASQNDGVRLNGGVGSSGGKADLLMQFGKIMGAYAGLHVGGAFGGLLADNIDVIGNWHNFVIDQALAAEFNREIFLGPHAVFDSSGALSSPTVPGPAAQSGLGDNVLINDPNGGFLVIKGWASAAGGGGSNIHVAAWSGTINIDGCLIPYASADGIRIDSTIPTVIVSPTTQLHGNAGYGINQTVAMNPVIGSPVFNTNTLGPISPTTKLQAAVLQAPADVTSIQTGAANFLSFGAINHYCTAYGNAALQENLNSGTYNTAFGSLAGYGVTGSSNNTFIGAGSGYAPTATIGNGNTMVGALTGYALTTGANNTVVGYNCAVNTTTGSGNIYIGTGGGGVCTGTPTESNTLRIGGSGTNVFAVTGINTTSPTMYLTWLQASPSYASDAAAATGGVPVGGVYRNGSQIMVRVT